MSTLRKRIIHLLLEEQLNTMELSAALSIPEKDVSGHLEHICRSIKKEKMHLVIDPYHCLSCGYNFRNRKRLDRPGRCPKCKSGHIRMAVFRIESR